MSADPAARLARRLAAAPAGCRRALLGEARRHPGVVLELKRLADGRLRADARGALRFARLARRAARATSDPGLVAAGEHALAKALHAAQRYREAEALYGQARERYRALGRRREEAAVRLARVGALFHLGRIADAEQEARLARRAYRRAGDPVGEAKVLVNLANVRHSQDRHREALRLLELARPVLALAGEREALVHVDLNRANSWSLLARFDRSGELYRSARAGAAALGLAELAARVDYNLAYDCFLRGQLREARRLLAVARSSFRRAGATYSLALTARDEAEMSLLVGLPSRAAEAALEARGLFRALRAPLERARASLIAGQALRALGDGGRARALFAEARRLFSARSIGAGAAAADLALAASAGESRSRRAERARGAAGRFARLGMRGRQATALALAGSLETDPGSARALLLRARRLARSHRLLEVELRAEHALGRSDQAAGRPRPALRHYRRAVAAFEGLSAGMGSEEDRLAFGADRAPVFRDALSAALDLGRLDEAFDLLERARARTLVDLLAADPGVRRAALRRAGAAGAACADLARRFAPLEARVRDARRRAGVVPGPVAERLERLESARREAERRLGAGAPVESYTLTGSPRAALAEVQAALGRERALVHYFAEGPLVGALVVTDAGIAARRNIAPAGAIDDALALLRFAVAAPPGASGEASAALAGDALERLGAWLVRPLAPLVGERGLVVVPTAELHVVPFHALGCHPRPLDEREVVVAPSATALLHALGRRPATRGALVLAAGDARTPAIAGEVRAVRRTLGARVLAGRQASASALARLAPRHRVLHFAAHGVFDPSDPLAGGIELAGGRLTAPALAALGLDAALVTLACCESAAGAPRGEEVLGLTRAVLLAGSRTLVASLWPASDLATAALMAELYTRLAGGAGVAAALAAAAAATRRRHPHPRDWAPFVAVGAWSGILP